MLSNFENIKLITLYEDIRQINLYRNIKVIMKIRKLKYLFFIYLISLPALSFQDDDIADAKFVIKKDKKFEKLTNDFGKMQSLLFQQFEILDEVVNNGLDKLEKGLVDTFKKNEVKIDQFEIKMSDSESSAAE